MLGQLTPVLSARRGDCRELLTTCEQKAWSFTQAWNQLPSDLKLQQLTTTFRRHLKTFLFQWAFFLWWHRFDCVKHSWST